MISIETDSISINEIFDNIQSGQHECISGMKDNIIITSAISDIVQLDADGFFYDFT